jgi:hypothetical protein
MAGEPTRPVLPPTVFFGTPTYDKTVTIDHDNSMIEAAIILTQLGVRLQRHVEAGGIYLGMIRNKIVEAFLASDADDLLFVDADVGFDARVLPRILTYKQEIVGGLVPKRSTERDNEYHQGALTGLSADGLFQALEIPTAFLRIKRSAFEKLEKPYFRSEADPDAYGEDIWFCRKWCATGNFLWVDADISFSHRGSRAWRGNFYDHCVATGLLKQPKAA